MSLRRCRVARVALPITIAGRSRWSARLLLTLVGLTLLLPAPVAAADGLQLSTPYPGVVVAPGSRVSFDISIRTTDAERVSLSLEGVPADWTAVLRGGGFVIDAAQTQAGSATTVRLDVTTPPTAAASTTRIEVVGRTGSETVRLPLDVRVSPEAAGQVALRTDFPQLRGPSDANFRFTLTLANDTAEDQAFAVTAAGPSGWQVDARVTSQAQAASAIVQAGGTTAIEVTARPPANVAAGTYPIIVEATGGQHTARTDLAVEVTGSYQVSLTTPDGRLNAQASAGSVTDLTFVVRNTGTAPLDGVRLTATTPSEWSVTFEPEVVSVPPGDEVQVTARLTPSSEAIAGDYVTTFRVANDFANAQAQVRVTVETSLLWGAVGLGLIAAVFIGLILVFQRYGRR
jgi:uncharacterized membrane protein